MHRTLPKPIQPGQKVSIIGASSHGEDIPQACMDWLKREGFEPVLGNHAMNRSGMFAGTDAERAQDFQQAFDDPEVGFVLSLRGGYGASRIIPHVDWKKVVASRKMLCGFSDTTALHLAIHRHGGVSLHGPDSLAFNREREPWVWESLHNAMRGGNSMIETAPKGRCLVGGKSMGVVAGGCLTLLSDSMGTDRSFDCRDKIVLIEDVHERPHRIDAMLVNLLQAGHLSHAKAVVMGTMSGTDEQREDELDPTWTDIVLDLLAPLKIPVMVDFPFGHIRNYLTLPLGIRAEIDAEQGTLTYLEPHCK
ncbi:MAG: LD-carboxypeptidase [Armatimonadetes bacterium]|nr:LD-carboxypeptidase [Armatimonadota bacterium]